MNKNINVLELASELAHKRLEIQWEHEGRTDEMTIEDDGGCIIYTEEAQDLFNEYYDEYLDLITEQVMDMDMFENPKMKSFIDDMDWKLLREQKNVMQQLIAWKQMTMLNSYFEGIIHLIDSIQDYAVDVLKIDSGEVFGDLDIKEE